MSPPMALHNGHSVPTTNGHSNGASNGTSAAVPIVDPTAMRRPVDSVRVESEQTTYTDTHIVATSIHENTLVTRTPSGGLMLVGWGGNNGTTVTATILANKHNISWRNREGIQTPNYIGSIVRASTLRLGSDAQTGKDVHIPLSDMLPMVHPNDLVIGGWDISGMPLDQAMRRAKVMEWDLQDQLNPLMSQMKPLPSVYYPDLGGRNKIVISNTCQDSLLAIPLIIDLVIITELLTRVQYRKPSGNSTEESDYQKIYPVLSLLSSDVEGSTG
ncbi:hypothetical protein KEM48_003643 [Puccinia striiformis f. sp. tritici PST-130]|nr:hypothetical protein KEM48_003643 [Puccinia striiformis f. sp. tritici PST-130]